MADDSIPEYVNALLDLTTTSDFDLIQLDSPSPAPQTSRRAGLVCNPTFDNGGGQEGSSGGTKKNLTSCKRIIDCGSDADLGTDVLDDLINLEDCGEVVYETCGLSTHSVGNIPCRDSSHRYGSCGSSTMSLASTDGGDDGGEGVAECLLGISEIEAPHNLSGSEGGSSSEDVYLGLSLLDDGDGLGAEDYYASLFARCDPSGTGTVKVSKLLNTLRELQALVNESEDSNTSVRSGGSSIEELLQLKDVIDPVNEDPGVSLNTFTKGIASYLERKKWSYLSPIKCSSMMEDGSVEMCSWPRKNVRFDGQRSSSFLDLSRISSSDQNFSLEALAGTASSLLEDDGEEPPDYRAEISDLQLQIQKLNDDNVVLKGRVSIAQDENFTLLQSQRDELDKKDVELKTMGERMKKLERELGDKNLQISSLEDRNTVLTNRNVRLENECSSYQKERKELVIECEESKSENRKTLRLVSSKEEEIGKLKNAGAATEKQWAEKERWMNERTESLTQTVDALSQRIEKLELEKSDLETKITIMQKSETSRQQQQHHHNQTPKMIYAISHQDSFDLDCSSDDIQSELLAAEGCISFGETQSSLERFDVATQCSTTENNKVDEEDVEMLNSLVDDISELLFSLHQIARLSSSTATDDELCKVDQMPNGSGGGSDSVTKRRKKKNKGAEDDDAHGGQDGSGSKDSQLLSESNATVVVRQINRELAEFREQLKKSQELFSVLRYNSCQSISLTKSCPGLSLDPSDTLKSANNKSVSCGTQTDSPVIETPILAQKLALHSPLSNSHHRHHHELTMSGGGLPHFMSNDSMDNPSFDKLSDDGSVRVRDDLSMVLEVSEQETETSPGPGRRTMSLDKVGSINRPKLTRMPNATEEEPPHSNSRASDSHHHLLHVDEGLTSDNDYVSATSSQAESVYLSLERPLKVTISSKDDRSSGGNYRSCTSSISVLRNSRSGGLSGAGIADCDTASLISEGNTTFGSPLSSPSSPYWTPSQGSSSQETITDGDRTPVNEEHQYRSNTDICSGLSHRSHLGSPSRSEPSSDLRKGVIPQSRLGAMMQNAYDCPARANDKDASVLTPGEWKVLREDIDRHDKELYRKTYPQEEGNEDDGGAGVEGGVAHNSCSAFASDEEAERYLELFPNLAESLFQAFDRESSTIVDHQDLEKFERKFNHMAEVFQTDHTNLEQRINALSKDFKESQVNLKEISQSLKSSVCRLNEIYKSNNIVPDDVLEVMKTLSSTSDEFELYSSTMCRNARRMGMMDVQNRLHKMLEVMILYVHIIRTKYDNLKSDADSLLSDFTKATKLLDEKGITFSPSPALGSLQNNNNNDEKGRLWDDEELENSHSDRCEDGDSEPEILQHLLGPKKSSAGLNRKERPLLQEKRSSDNLLVRVVAEGYEVLRRELFWPWNLEQTIKGLKQGFSVVLMILGFFVFIRSFLPSVSAIDEGCMTNPSFFRSIGDYFSYCGDLSHDDAPVI